MADDTEKDIIKKLILIRYMHRQAEAYSELSGPRSVISVLMFHDAVDLWLQTAAHRLGVRTNKRNIFVLDYMKLIDEALKEEGGELVNEYPIKQLNQARNSFKHSGNVPDTDTIVAFRTNVRDFLQENTRTVFDLDFQSLSMIDLLEEGQVKDILELAQEAVKGGDYMRAAMIATLGFKALVVRSEYYYLGAKPGDLSSLISMSLPGLPYISEGRRETVSKQSIRRRRSQRSQIQGIDFLDALTGASSPLEEADVDDPGSEKLDLDGPLTDDEIIDLLNNLGQRVSILEDSAFLTEYGIDASEYRRFTMLAIPHYYIKIEDGQPVLNRSLFEFPDDPEFPDDLDEMGRDDAEFMLGFVADCAVQVQSIDAMYAGTEGWA